MFIAALRAMHTFIMKFMLKIIEQMCDAESPPHRLVEAGWWRPASWQWSDASAWRHLVPDLLHLYSNFGGRQIIVAANDNWPFLGLTLLGGGAAAPRSGIDINILDTLSAKLNFT